MTDSPLYEEYADGIAAIDTGYLRPQVAASHLIADERELAFVDCGTSHSVPRLLEALHAMGRDPADVTYLFLTHIHLDHAGGAGALMQALPNATAVLHPRGARHMIDPEKLILGSTAVYGEETFRRLFGEIVPIDEARVKIVEDGERLRLGGRDFECIHTEGHARHHYCLIDAASDSIFTGDSFGVAYRAFNGAQGAFVFPTTTPVHFDPDAAHASVDRLAAYKPSRLFVCHYSRITGVPRLAEDMHRSLNAFVAIAQRHADDSDRQTRMEQSMFEYLWYRLDEHGYDGPDENRRKWLELDVKLNAMGLD
ncbi:MAG: MBL fold metallo-hydrolase, partial [Pseudomonadota bacterium]